MVGLPPAPLLLDGSFVGRGNSIGQLIFSSALCQKENTVQYLTKNQDTDCLINIHIH